jgi:hypothetical protein
MESIRRLKQAAGMDADNVKWITVNGARVPLKDGQPQNETGKRILGEVKPRGIVRDKPPVAHLSGDELGIRKGETVKDAAKRYYEGLMKDPANREGFGEVKFYKGHSSGWGKLESTSLSDDEQLKLLPAVKPVIERGEYLGYAKPTINENDSEKTRRRKESIAAYHYFEANVSLNGKNKYVGVTVIEDKYGNKFYNLVKDPDIVYERKGKAAQVSHYSQHGARAAFESGSGNPDLQCLGAKPLGNATDSADGILNIIVGQNPPDFKDMTMLDRINSQRGALGLPPAARVPNGRLVVRWRD